jgi:3'-phosphoadenosine 5'-phosphosulfate (PAPS) 3'-phosphatase
MEVSPRADQRLNKIVLQRLASYAPNDKLVIGLGTRRER